MPMQCLAFMFFIQHFLPTEMSGLQRAKSSSTEITKKKELVRVTAMGRKSFNQPATANEQIASLLTFLFLHLSFFHALKEVIQKYVRYYSGETCSCFTWVFKVTE